MIRTKADVEMHRDGYYGEGFPAVNVKCGTWIGDFTDELLIAAATEGIGDHVGEFLAWWHALEVDDELDELINRWWEIACEDGWDMLRDDAREVFGPQTSVSSAGRSGGWCIVTNLPDIECWDAIDLARWRRFAKWARAVADDVPYRIAWYLAVNEFEPEREAQARVTEIAATDYAASLLPVQLIGA